MKHEKKADPFYTTEPWLTLRRLALERDHYICQICLKKCEMGRMIRPHDADTVHHIKHREEYPELQYDLDNLISLCRACHNEQHPERGFTAQRKAGLADEKQRCVTIRNDRSMDDDGHTLSVTFGDSVSLCGARSGRV